MISTRDDRVEKARETACDTLGVVRDSLSNSHGRHTPLEQDLLVALAARIVLQATDNDLSQVQQALSAIKNLLYQDYPHLLGIRNGSLVHHR